MAVLLYAPHFIKDQREGGQLFMVAYVKALLDHWDAYTSGINKAEVIETLVRHRTITDAALFAQMTPAGLNPDGYINVRGFADDVEWYSNYGYVRGRIDPAQVADKFCVDYAIDRRSTGWAATVRADAGIARRATHPGVS